MAYMRISNAGIDSGNWIDLRGVSVIPGYKKSNEALTINGVSKSSLPEGDRIGIEPPSFTIKGVINIDDYDSTPELWSETPSSLSSTAEDGTSNVLGITLGYINALWRNLDNETKIKIYLGNPSNKKTWKNWNNTSDEIYVIIDDIVPLPQEDSEGLHFITYSLVMREVAPDGTYTS